MPASILVTYASRYGSTQQVAEAIAATLREGGLNVHTRPVQEVHSLDGYGAVVLGAALYASRWHQDAHHFLSEHRSALSERPVAVFALGPFHPEAKKMQGSRAQLDKELAHYPWLRPLAVEMFVGKLDPAKLRFPESLFMRWIPATDRRDWTAIRAWASSLAAQLTSALPQAGEAVLVVEKVDPGI